MLQPSVSIFPAGKSVRIFEGLLALAVAVLIVAGIAFFTNSMAPKWDSDSYMDMARLGVFGNDHLVAPFAYSPGMPYLVHVVSGIFSISLEQGFVWVTRFAAVLFLFAAFLLVRCFTPSTGKAMLPMLFVGISCMHVKVPLFCPAAVDVAAFPIMVLAVWAFVKRRLWFCFWVSILGLFFKEFLAIPLLLTLLELAWVYQGSPNRKSLLLLGSGTLLALGAILVPRLGLHVVATYQEIDPVHRPRSLGRLILDPLNVRRDINIVLDAFSYWLPSLLLLTPDRWRNVRQSLMLQKTFILGFLALNFLLVMYGGTNILIFMSYSVPVQLMVLGILLGMKIHPAEWALALICLLLYNRTFWAIPLPDKNFDAFIDFYEGWASRVNLSTLRHFLEIALYLLAMGGLRHYLRKRTPHTLTQANAG